MNRRTSYWGAVVLLGLMCGSIHAATSVTHLRCEVQTDPRGIDQRRPQLSWQLSDTRRGVKQIGYQVLVARSAESLRSGNGDLWDSGRVESHESAHVSYAGSPLQSRMEAFWKVRVWTTALDATGRPANDAEASPWSEPARWSMGLLDPEDWSAKWIGDNTPLPTPLQAHNGYHSQLANSADAVKWISIDLESSREIDAITLWPARPFDWKRDEPGFLFPLRFRIEVADSPDFATPRVVADRSGEDNRATTEPLRLTFSAAKGRFVRLITTRLAMREANEFGIALAEMEVHSGGEVVSRGRAVVATDSVEHNSWSTKKLVDGDLRSHAAGPLDPLPPLSIRRDVTIEVPAARRATAFVTALGCYELKINGQRVGDHVLAPEWTNFHKAVQYQTYDVSELIRAGENTIDALVGDGWYAGRIGLAHIVPDGPIRGLYGRRPAFLCQIEIESPDGTIRTIATDESWWLTTMGTVRVSDLLDGESYAGDQDIPRPPPGEPWKQAAVVDVAHRGNAPVLRAQPNQPIRITREIRPIAVTEPKPGVFVFDMGQNMVGWCRFTPPKLASELSATPVEVTLRHAEVLNPDGTIYTANLRNAAQTDRYRIIGKPASLAPHFTYHGFRYVEVTGLAGKPPLDSIIGCVINSDCPEVGRFECSNPHVNKLMQNILWTQRANLMSVPTDCPQRDERLGWTGDILAFAQTACFNMDMQAFYRKWMTDMREAQADDGRFPDFAPHPFDPNARFSGVAAWADAGVFVPWTAFVNYGDRRIIEENFDAMKRWVDWIATNNPDHLWKNKRHNDYGDWLNADTLKLDRPNWPKSGSEMPKEAFATAFFARSSELLSRMAGVIGRDADAKKYAELSDRVKRAFREAYVTPDGRIKGDTQAGYAIALAFDLLGDEDADGRGTRPVHGAPAGRASRPPGSPNAVAHMIAGFDRYNGLISTGFHSTICLMNELSRAGRSDLAYRLLLNREMPSWLYPIEHGATTIWERWDGFVAGRGFQDPGMNSFSHYAIGSVGEWIWRTVVGINPDESTPGYGRTIIRPIPGGDLTWARGEFDSPPGTILVNWRIEGGRFIIVTTIPAGNSAILHMPVATPDLVRESDQPAAGAPGVTVRQETGEAAVFEIGSGTYRFECPWPAR